MTKKIYSLLVFVVGLAVYLIYVLSNQELPRGDEAFNFEFSQRIFLNFQAGKTGFLESLFWERTFRPNVLTSLGALLLILTGGNIFIAQAVLTAFQFSLYYAGCYLIFNGIKSRAMAIGYLTLAISFPWVFGSMTVFSSEGLGLAMLTWAFVCFQRIEFSRFHDKSNSFYLLLFSVFSGILILAKPVEGILIFGSFYLIIFISLQNGFVNAIKNFLFTLAFLAGPIAFCVYDVLYSSLHERESLSLFYLSLLTIPFCFVPARNVALKNLVILIAPCSLLAYGWYGAFSHRTFSWAFTSSFGQMAQITGGRGDVGWLNFLATAAAGYFGILFCFFLVLKAAFDTSWNRAKVCFTLALLFPILAGSLTYNADLRYYVFSAIGGFFVICSSSKRPDSWIKKLTVCLFAGLFFFHMLSVFGKWERLSFLSRPYFGIWPKNYQTKKDSLHEILTTLKGKVDLLKENQFCLLRMHSQSPLDQIFDPFISAVILKGEGLKAEVIMPFPHSQNNMTDRFRFIVKPHCCYVGVFPTQYVQAPVGHFLNDVGELFLKKHADQSIAELDYSFIGSLHWRFYEMDAELKLFKSNTGICK